MTAREVVLHCRALSAASALPKLAKARDDVIVTVHTKTASVLPVKALYEAAAD